MRPRHTKSRKRRPKVFLKVKIRTRKNISFTKGFYILWYSHGKGWFIEKIGRKCRRMQMLKRERGGENSDNGLS